MPRAPRTASPICCLPLPSSASNGETDLIPLPTVEKGWPNLQDRGGADTALCTRDAHRIALCFCLCFFLLTQIAAIINKPKGRTETAWQFSLAACAPTPGKAVTNSSACVCWP